MTTDNNYPPFGNNTQPQPVPGQPAYYATPPAVRPPLTPGQPSQPMTPSVGPTPAATPQQPPVPYAPPQQPTPPYAVPQQPTVPYATPQQPPRPLTPPAAMPARPLAPTAMPARPVMPTAPPAAAPTVPQRPLTPSPTALPTRPATTSSTPQPTPQPVPRSTPQPAQQPMPQPAVLRNQPPTGRTSVYTAQSQPTMPRPAQPPTAYRPTAQPVASQLAQLTPSQPLKKPVSRLALFMTSLGGVIVGGVLVFALIFAWTGGFAQQPTTSSGDITAESLNSTATAQDSNPGPVQIQPTTPITITPLSEDATLSEAVAAKCLPSVVNIDVYVKSSSANGSSQGWSDSTNDSSLLEYALGSGVVLTEDGYILTNYHVVEAGDEFLVRFDKDTQLRAVLVGFDESSDLAVLKVDATGLTPMEMGDSSALLPGQWVMALGSPFGLDKSVSVGIVSALFRSTTMEGVNALTIYANMIQTDAAINPGNSGGALVNAQGQLIGINTLIMSATDSSAGVGFAIPSNYAWNIAQQIMAGKTVEHAFLGVQMTTVDPSTAASLHTTATAGAYVNQVVNGSPAAQAGIQTGDVIVRVGDSPIATASEVILEIRGHLVGDVVTVEVLRNGQVQDFSVTLGSDQNQ